MGLKFNHILKGGNAPAAASSIQYRNSKQLTPQNIQFLIQIGLKPNIGNGNLRHWS
jgi:hypothetical protein